MTPIPDREEDGQTALEADGGHDAQASEVEEPPQDHKEGMKTKAVVEERLQDLADREQNLEAEIHEICDGQVEAVDEEGGLLVRQMDKPDHDSIYSQSTKGHSHGEGPEGHMPNIVGSFSQPRSVSAGVIHLAVIVHGEVTRARQDC